MRQIRTSGSEGGEAAIKAVFPTPIHDPQRDRHPRAGDSRCPDPTSSRMLADTLNVPVRQAKLPQNVGNRRTAAPPAVQNDDIGRIGAGAEIRIYLYNASPCRCHSLWRDHADLTWPFQEMIRADVG